jgi:RimJ/RimL family protein N-acetyltransferase
MITEETFLDFKCPYCGEANSFPQTDAGLLRECFNCMESLLVPISGADAGGRIPLPITTQRLLVRRFEGRDSPDLLGFLFEEEEEAIRWLENNRKVKLTTPEQMFFLGLEFRDEEKIIGRVGLQIRGEARLEAQVYVELNEKYRRQGFALEALDGVLGFCFEGLGLHRVVGNCDSKDAPACRLFECVGMRREAEFVKSYLANGEWRNELWYAALDEEWLEAAKDSES